MNQFKKISLAVVLGLSLNIMSCGITPTTSTSINSSDVVIATTNTSVFSGSTNSSLKTTATITIYSINDFHGALEEKDDKGFSYISGYIKDARKNDKNAIFISNGDALQGTALSNLNQGSTVIEAFNLGELDVFNIGNHEFDWGIDTVKSYFDETSSSPVKANYPALGANIYEKATDARIDWIKPYTVIKKEDVSIGVIGVMGAGLEYAISPVMIEPYKFVSPTPIVEQYASYLRDVEKVDIVVVATHDEDDTFNQNMTSLKDNKKIDALINAHSHRTYSDSFTRSGYAPLPYVQSGSSGSNIGKITLDYSLVTKKVTSSKVENIYIPTVKKSTPNIKDSLVVNYINQELDKIAPVVMQPLGVAGEYVDRTLGTKWAADLIKAYTNADFGCVNSGGIRASGFPINKGQTVTYSSLIEISPFDNYIKSAYLNGAAIKAFKTSSGVIFDSSYNANNINNSTYYKIATVDYVFDQKTNPFLNGNNIDVTTLLLRDIMKDDILLATSNSSQWFPSQGPVKK